MLWVAPSEKDTGTEILEDRLWKAADQLRANSGLTSAQYSQPVLGLIFLRFAEIRFKKKRAVLEKRAAGSRRGSRVDDPTAYQADGLLYLTPKARFDYLLRLPEGADAGKAVNEAMRDIEARNPQLAGVLPKTYQIFESTLLKGLLKRMSEIPDTVEGDVFGRIYEYFLAEFARAEGSRGGEFYTPTSIVRLLVEVLEPFHGRVLDPACGSGGMFVQSARFVTEHRKNPNAELAVHGQEKVAETVKLCRMNLAVHGLEGDIREGISYYDDLHSATGRFDFVLAKADEAIKIQLQADPSAALTLDLPPSVRNLVADCLHASDLENFTEWVRMVWFFSKSPEIVGFKQDELQGRVDGRVEAGRVAAFLAFASTDAHAIEGEPDLLALAPTAKTPLVRHHDRFYLFVPGVFFEAIYYAFHRRLFADEAYRSVYDRVRAAWLERSAVQAFRQMLPNAEAGWGLAYGPKQHRLDLDGLVRYDNKVILIECKWKSPTLVALGGDVVAALRDVEGAILQPLAQAKRARDWIQKSESAEFIEKASGRRIVVRRDEIAEVFLVTLVGSGAWAQIAANLTRLAPLGLFSDGEYPWALSVNDLRVVAECLELPSQLFDYLRRRYEVQRNPKFRFHDEWDVLGAYLAGALDVHEPQFAESDLVALDGFDGEIQDYYYGLSNLDVVAKKPSRPLPDNIRELLLAVERAHSPQKTDAICVVLSWPNHGLEELGKSLDRVRKKAVWDGRAHAVALRHPWKSMGVSFSCGFKNRRSIQDLLWRACDTQVASSNATEWVGFGVDLAEPWNPIVVYYNKTRRQSQPPKHPKIDGAR